VSDARTLHAFDAHPLVLGGALGALAAALSAKAVLVVVAAFVLVAMLVYPVASLYMLLVILPVSVDFGGGLTITRVVAPCALLLMLGNALARRSPWPDLRRPEALLALLFFAAATLSVLYSADRAKALADLGGAGVWVALFFATLTFVRTPRDVSRVMTVVVAVAVVEALLTVAQVHFRFVMPGDWRMASLEGIDTNGAGSRAEGTATHPIMLAGFLLMVMPLAACKLMGARGAMQRAVLIVALALIVEAWYSTYARSSMVAIATMLVAAIAAGSRLGALVVLAVLAAAVALLAAHGFDVPAAIRSVEGIHFLGEGFRYADLYDSVSSFRFREESWAGGMQLFLAHPLLGVGLGQAIDAYMAYLPYWATSPVHPAEIHNTFIEVAAELGVFTLLVFVGLWLCAFFGTLRAWRDPELGRYARALFVVLVGQLVFLLFTPMVRDIWLTLPLAAALAPLAAARARARSAEAARP
jgi:O-antigen ligase